MWNQHLGDSVRDRTVRFAAAFRMPWSAVILHLRNLTLIQREDEFRSLDGRIPEELKAPSLSPGITAVIIEAYMDRRMPATRVVELLRGGLEADDLPEQRVTAARRDPLGR
jgi:hypothetical protein